MADELDIKLRYVGKRFEGAKLPLEVLTDLPAFRDLLVAYARELWHSRNVDRERVPKGFDRSLSFDLTAIEDGSAVPKLSWDRDAAQERLPGFADELELLVFEAFDRVVDLVVNAANDVFPKVLPLEHVRALNRFGSSLRDDERIELVGASDRDGKVVYLDSARRKALITKVRETYVSRYEGTGTLVGVYVAADDQDAHVVVDTDSYGRISICLDGERIVAEFDGNMKSIVQFDLEVELDNADKLRSVVEVHALTLIDEQLSAELERCRARLEQIRQLQDGWDGEGSKGVNPVAYEAASTFLTKRPAMASQYKIYPTRAGGILFEFESNGWDLSVEFSDAGNLELFGIEAEGDAELLPIQFPAVDDQFIQYFDRQVGRDGR